MLIATHSTLLVLGSHHILEQVISQAIEANVVCPLLSPLPSPKQCFSRLYNFFMQRIYLLCVMTALKILFGHLMLALGLIGLNEADICHDILVRAARI